MSVLASLDAERAVVGAMVLRAEAIPEAAGVLVSSDFASPALRAVFDACCDLWKIGVRPDAAIVHERLRASGGAELVQMADLVSLVANAVTFSPLPHAQVVADYAARRRLVVMAETVAAQAKDLSVTVDEVAARAQVELEGAKAPGVSVDDVMHVDDFSVTAESPLSWVIPGLIDEQDRVIIVAPEGMGKTMVLRWMVASVAQGMHPFTAQAIPAANTLLVDLENPARIIRKTLRPMLAKLRGYYGANYDPARCSIWHRPGGINLRTRSGAAEFDAVLSKVQPRLVCLGPLYKAYRGESAQREHDTASQVAAVLDDLRTRHGFALVLEAHAPLKQGGVRDLRPFGSLLWQQWPEIGIKLMPEGKEGTAAYGRTLGVGHWRGSRDERCWPIKLTRAEDWPWVATYADDRWKNEPPPPALDDF